MYGNRTICLTSVIQALWAIIEDGDVQKSALSMAPLTSGRRSVDCGGADAVGTGKVGDGFAVLASVPRFLRL